MIGNAPAPSWSFKWLAVYLEHGKRGAEAPPDRVAWVETRNLPTNHLHAAARIMAATARDSDSVQPPVYHLTISFDPGDPLDRATVRQVVDRTLRDLSLAEYQAVIVAHRDRAHRHVHVMVNRVHPVRLKVWNNWFDWRRIERSLRKQEDELGLRVVPGTHAPVPEHSPRRTPAPRRIRGDAAFLARVKEQAGPVLLTPRTSWEEVERRLGDYGLSVQIKHGGLVVTDGVFEVKGSEIDRAASRNHLERRLGALGAYRARQAVAARTLDERAARLRRAEVAPEQTAPASLPPQVQQRTPASAPAPAEPRPQPPQVVEQRPPAAAPVPAPATPPQPEPIPERWRLPLHAAANLIRDARLRDAEARRLDAVFLAGYVEAPQELKRLKGLRQRAVDDSVKLRGVLVKVYNDAADAARRLRKHVNDHGLTRTLEGLRQTPEQFGTLRPAGLLGRTALARSRVPEVLDPLRNATASLRECPSADELRAAEQRAQDGISAGIAARDTRWALPPASLYERQAADRLRPLLREVSPQRLAHMLARLLPPEDREAAEIAVRVIRLASTPTRGAERKGVGLDIA